MGNVIFVTALFRKQDWEYVGGYSTEMVSGIEDYDFWLSILELGRQVYCIPDVLFKYRIRENSRSKNFGKDKENILAMYQVIHQRHKQLYIDNYEDFTVEMHKTILEERSKFEKFKSIIPFIGLIESCLTIKRFILNKMFQIGGRL